MVAPELSVSYGRKRGGFWHPGPEPLSKVACEGLLGITQRSWPQQGGLAGGQFLAT